MSASWYDTDWQYRKKITIDKDQVGGSGSHSNFPVLVRLSSDSDLSSHAQADGDDILFTSSNGTTKLDHEIEKYTSGTGALVAWVRVPILSGSNDTELYIYYGNASCSDQQNATEVWDSYYKAVWHMDDLTTSSIEDSTSNNHDGTKSGVSQPAEATGLMADAQHFDPGNNTRIDVASSSDFGMGTGDFTIEMWVNLDTNPQYKWFMSGGDANHFDVAHFGSGYNELSVYFEGGNYRWSWSPATSTWYHLVVTRSGTDLIAYIDANQQATKSSSDNIATTAVNLGDQWNGSYYFDGLMDEVRISKGIARSGDWVTTCYNNQKSPSTFLSLGSEEENISWYSNFWRYRKRIVIDKDKVSGTSHTDFPVLIKRASDSDLSSHAQADGDDILFTSSNGTTKLDHEIEDYDNTTGELWAWVKIPTLSGSADTTLWMYYGNPYADDQQNPTSVWSSDYKGVWHMNDLTTSTIEDSISSGNNGTKKGANEPIEDDVQIGKGQHFDGSDDYIIVGDTSTFKFLHGALDTSAFTFTVSFWFARDVSEPDAFWYLVGTGTTGSAGVGLDIAFEDRSGGAKSRALNIVISRGVAGQSVLGINTANNVLPDDTDPHLVTVTYDQALESNNAKVYVDGSLVGQFTKNAYTPSTSNASYALNLGRVGSGSYYMDGKLDETRILDVVRSANWISTEYNSQGDPGTFFSVGAEDENPNYTVAWYDEDWLYRKEILIDSSKVEGTSHTDFPVLINLASDSDLSSHAQTYGEDILITSSNAITKLNHEIERYTTGTGELVLWVKVPTLSGSVNTRLWLYYGNATCESQQNPTGVWDSSTEGVWHLTDTFDDSTSNNNDLTNVNTTDVAAKIADGRYCDGNDEMHRTLTSSLKPSQQINVSMWVKPRAQPSVGNKYEFARAFVPAAAGNFTIQYVNSGGTMKIQAEIRESGGTYQGMYEDKTLTTDTAYLVELVADGSQVRLRVDGSYIGSYDTYDGTIRTDDGTLYIGCKDGSDRFSVADFDEVRIESVARSQDWAKTRYNNENSPSTFYSLGSEQEQSPSWYDDEWQYRKQIIIDATQVSGSSHTDFPVLINLSSDADLMNYAQSDGDDILFTSSNGTTKLNHEIERYTTATGELIAWVKVPTLSGVADTVLWMYYGNPYSTDQQSVTGVWASAWESVWHFADVWTDSTSNNRHGTNHDASFAEAQIGKGSAFSPNDYVETWDLAYGSSGDFSIAFWIKTSGDTQPIASDRGVGSQGLLLEVRPDSKLRVQLSNGVGGYGIVETDASIADGNWHYIVASLDRSGNGTIWRDGGNASSADISSAGDIDNANDFELGRESTNYFTGWLDEFRFYTGLLTSDYAATAYNNQNSPSSFYSVGVQQDNTTPWYGNHWRYRKKITIDNTKVSGSSHTDFPVLVSLSSDDDISSNAQSDGDDILFTSEDGTTKLSHEIELYTNTTGELIAWVKVPTLSGSANTLLWLYYGNPESADQQNPTGVWGSEYKGVWHAKDLTTSSIEDSTSAGNDGSKKGANEPIEADAKIGKGQHFDGSDDRITVGDTSTFKFLHGALDTSAFTFTISFWLSRDVSEPNAYWGLIATGRGASSWIGTDIAFEDTAPASRQLGLVISRGVVGQPVITAFSPDNVLPDDTDPHLITVTYDQALGSNNAKIYVDDTLVHQGTKTANTPSTSNSSYALHFGSLGDNTYFSDGKFDEITIADVVRSADWIATEYNNQDSPSTFFELTAESENPDYEITPWYSNSWQYRKKIVIDKDKVSGSSHTDFPVLINLSSDDDLKNDARSDGYDILVTSDDGTTKLDHEIERFDNTTGELILWTRVPTLSGTDDTVLWLYYGNPYASDQQNIQDVWDSDFKRVYHLKETSGSTATDSTGNYNGTYHDSLPDAVPVKVGYGQDFDGSGDYIAATTSTWLVPANVTVEFWFRFDVYTTGDYIMGWYHQSLDRGWALYPRQIGGNSYLELRFDDDADHKYWYANFALSTGTLYHAVVMQTGVNEPVMVINGTSRAIVLRSSSGSPAKNDHQLTVGCEGAKYANFFDGDIDEFRISDTNRGTDWASTSYENQSTPSDFYDKQVEEINPNYVQTLIFPIILVS
jgi:hypothetical protein